MSSTKESALKSRRYGQQELRRLMEEQKLKIKAKEQQTVKVNSPLAKYDSTGNLTCIICRVNIKSANVWKVHINSRQHKLKLEATKHLKESIKTTVSQTQKLPQHHNKSVENTSITDSYVKSSDKLDVQGTGTKVKEATSLDSNQVLPENFFDDPVKDAQIRNIEYKNPQDEEWERFQREIKEQSVMSSAIVAGEQTETAVERELDEIDEQMHLWNRVITLDIKKNDVLKNQLKKAHNNVELQDSSSDENDSFDEFSDWRSKKF